MAKMTKEKATIRTDYKEAVKKSGLKQTFIAAKLGISSAHLSNFISGRDKLQKEKEDELKQILGIE